MPSLSLLAPPTISRLAPPYEGFTAVPDLVALRSTDLADGTLVAVGLAAPRDEWPAIMALVPRLRGRFPAAPVVLRVDRRASLRLQADQRVPLLTVAVECGYSDHSSLSRQCLRLFGVRPGAIRPTLGWEWLLDRWLRRADAGRIE